MYTHKSLLQKSHISKALLQKSPISKDLLQESPISKVALFIKYFLRKMFSIQIII